MIDNSLEKRQATEKIAIFIPKRNIETWIYYLQGNQVNEEDSYLKYKLKQESNCETCVQILYDQCQNQFLSKNAPPSLKIACQEFNRII